LASAPDSLAAVCPVEKRREEKRREEKRREEKRREERVTILRWLNHLGADPGTQVYSA